MRSRDELRPRYSGDPEFTIREAFEPQWKLNRFLYQLVGEQWQWTDKLAWCEAQWREYLTNVRTYLACYSGNIAGYYELLRHADDSSVQISYFGLAPEFIGRRLGAALLSSSLENAW